MESTVQSIANGHAIGSRVESAEDAICKLLANGSASDADRVDQKDDVQEFLDDAKASGDVEKEESDEADTEMRDEEPTPCDRVEPLRLADSLWKLDRRASGHLFWRRDSSTLQEGVDPSSRVKFRYDVTVREYADQQQESDQEDEGEESTEEEEVEDHEGNVLRQRKRLPVVTETDKSAKSSSGWATSPIIIYSAVFLAILMAAVIHWYLWGRTAWANLTGSRRGGSV